MATVDTSAPVYMGDGMGMGGGSWIWLFAILFLFGFGGNGFGMNGATGGYATSAEVQRGFDTQNTIANQRETLAAVNDASARGIAATNQVYHDVVQNLGDKYSELARDIAGVNAGVSQAIANQCQLNGDLKLQIAETGNGINAGIAQNRFDSALNASAINANIAQNRFDGALNTAAINANMTAQTQKILDTIQQDKIDALRNRVNQLETQNLMAGVVKYPMSSVYSVGASPFCNCNGGFGYPLYN